MTSGHAMRSEIQFAPVPHEAAAKIISDRPVVTREVFKKMLPEMRARAFLISGVEDMNVVQQIRDRIADLPRGASWEDIREDIAKDLGPWMDEESAGKRATLLMRHHGFQAYAAAHYRVMDEQRAAFPYWQYLTMGDEKVRSSHAKLHGLILPANHPFWKDHYPPWDWNCRCQVVAVSEDEYRETVDAGRVPSKMNLTGKVKDDYDKKTRGWTLEKAGLKQLATMGRIDEGTGATIDVSSPLQRAQKEGPSAVLSAYQWNPAELGMSVLDLHGKYGKDEVQRAAFDAFYRNMQGATFLGPDGLERNVWDWCLSADMERAARDLLANPSSGRIERLAVLDHKTGLTIAGESGEADRVPFGDHAIRGLLEGRSLAMVHTHIEVGDPSPADIAALFRFSPTLKSIAVAEPGGRLHMVSAKTSRSIPSNLRMAKFLDRKMDQMDSGSLSEKAWKGYMSRMNRSGRLRYEARQKI